MPDASPVGIILVVDDEEGVRAVLRRQLSDGGHTVLEAGDGARRFTWSAAERRWWTLISATVMPQMNGTELATRIGIEFRIFRSC
jgi:CheY-like chemotaxis protein